MADVDSNLEYQERWDYVKHSEIVRDRAAGWYFTLVGVLLTAAYTGKLGLDPLLARPLILSFLTVYSLAIIFYLVGLKLSYREHVDRIRKLDQIGTEHRDRGFGAFSFYIYSIGLVGAGVTFAAIVEISEALAKGKIQAIPGAVCALIAASAFVVFVVLYNTWRLREE